MLQGLQDEFAQVMPTVTAELGWPSLFTAQAPDGNFSQAGEPSGNYGDVAGLVAIPCTSPPVADGTILAGEVKSLAEVMASELHHVLLNSWYPALDNGWRGDGTPAGAWRCIIDGVQYDILGIESDSHSIMTRVRIRLSTL
jgi:hypothetical protein